MVVAPSLYSLFSILSFWSRWTEGQKTMNRDRGNYHLPNIYDPTKFWWKHRHLRTSPDGMTRSWIISLKKCYVVTRNCCWGMFYQLDLLLWTIISDLWTILMNLFKDKWCRFVCLSEWKSWLLQCFIILAIWIHAMCLAIL